MTFKFDPFNIEEDSKAATDDTSKTTNTTNKRNKQQLVQQSNQSTLGQIPLHFNRITSSANNKRLPPKLTVKLSYHEEVSSSCDVDGGLCRLFVAGKIMVSIVNRTVVHPSTSYWRNSNKNVMEYAYRDVCRLK